MGRMEIEVEKPGRRKTVNRNRGKKSRRGEERKGHGKKENIICR